VGGSIVRPPTRHEDRSQTLRVFGLNFHYSDNKQL